MVLRVNKWLILTAFLDSGQWAPFMNDDDFDYNEWWW